MRLLIAALFSAALITIVPHVQITPVNKVASRTKVQAVQAKLSEKEPQVVQASEEKAQTEPQATTTGAAEQSGIKPDVQPQTPTIPSTHEELMAAAGINPEDYGAVDYIISHESGWCPFVHEGEGYCPSSPDYADGHAYGICQSLPGNKMALAGDDWLTNPVTQLKWCGTHAVDSYGSWWGAYSQWVVNHWW